MNKARLVSILGIFVVILPYLGFPNSWRKILFVGTGVMLIYLGYHLYRLFPDKKPRILSRNPRKSVKPPTSQSTTFETKEPLSFSKEE